MADEPPLAKMQGDLLRIRYETHLRGAVEGSRAVIEFALLGLRGLTIINGGALIGLVTFLGHYEEYPVAAGWLMWAYVFFVIGLCASFAAILCSYLSQTYFSWFELANSERDAQEIAGIDSTEKRKKASEDHKLGMIARGWAIFSAVASIVMFAAGAFTALIALSGAA
jgi:hypothetical protein